jgi:ubiquinone/menaquinone biosynthesis C-methylase UbiE
MVKAKLVNDGERMIPEYHRNTMGYGDHIARYESALPFVKSKVVLDIASGSGYGSQMLSSHASKVYGVDVDEKAIAYAKNHFSEKNIEFMVGDGVQIPLKDDAVDVVVTFETLEHIEDYKKFMSEIKRVLNDKGQLVISTPNDLEFPEGNHFHVHEFTYDELTTLLKQNFKYVESYYQGTWVYTGISNKEKISGEWDEKIRVINTAPINTDQALYFMAICSNQPIKTSVETLGVVSEHWSGKTISRQNQELQDYIKSTIAHYEGILKAKDEQILTQNAKIEELNKYIDNMASQKIIRMGSNVKSKLRRK